MLEPLAEDELGLLVLDVGLLELLLRDLEREGREVAAAEVGRDVGGREGDVAVLELHGLSIYVAAARSYGRPVSRVRPPVNNRSTSSSSGSAFAAGAYATDGTS